jgi:hypothetical protein
LDAKIRKHKEQLEIMPHGSAGRSPALKISEGESKFGEHVRNDLRVFTPASNVTGVLARGPLAN